MRALLLRFQQLRNGLPSLNVTVPALKMIHVKDVQKSATTPEILSFPMFLKVTLIYRSTWNTMFCMGVKINSFHYFLVDVYLKLKLYTPLFVVEFLLEILKNFSMFSASCPGKNLPSVISSSAVSLIYGDIHVFTQKNVTLNYNLY
jgi:hypothetical protein